MEQESDTVKDLYDLMEKYLVPIPPEDLAVYHTLKPAVSGLRNSVDKGVSQRDQYINKFCRMLDKDIVELGKEVKAIKNEAQVGGRLLPLALSSSLSPILSWIYVCASSDVVPHC